MNLGFTADQEDACYFYDQHDPRYYSIEVNNPEWGYLEGECDVRFFTQINEYGLIIYYYTDEQRFNVSMNSSGAINYAIFDYYAADGSRVDREISEDITVEEYFRNAYDDPEIEDAYLYSVQIMENYISDTFGMSIEELYALPAGE